MASTKKYYISPDLYLWLMDLLETEHDALFQAANAKADPDSIKFDLARLAGKRQVLQLIYTKLNEDDKHGISLWVSRHRAEPSGDQRKGNEGQAGGTSGQGSKGTSRQPKGWLFKPAQHRPANPRRRWWQLR